MNTFDSRVRDTEREAESARQRLYQAQAAADRLREEQEKPERDIARAMQAVSEAEQRAVQERSRAARQEYETYLADTQQADEAVKGKLNEILALIATELASLINTAQQSAVKTEAVRRSNINRGIQDASYWPIPETPVIYLSRRIAALPEPQRSKAAALYVAALDRDPLLWIDKVSPDQQRQTLEQSFGISR